MIDNAPSFANMKGVSGIEGYQADRRVVSPAFETKLSQLLLTQRPDLQKAIVSDPFSDATKAKVAGFDRVSTMRAVLRSAIMAEPMGEYEKKFAALTREEQREKLYDQIDSSARMTLRTIQYTEDYLEKIKGMPDEEAYKTLCRIAFSTDDQSEIDTQYAQSQRRGFRLGIANFLETREQMEKYKAEAAANPKGLAENILKKQFTGEVSMEHLPIGLVVYLDEKDYLTVTPPLNGPQSVPSNGITILDDEKLPAELRNRLIVINKGGEVGGVRSKKQLADTRKHEIRHVLFHEFHAGQRELLVQEIPEKIAACKNSDDFRRLSETLSHDMAERAKDEIAAYFSTGRLDTTYSTIRYQAYKYYLTAVGKELTNRKDITEEDRKSIFHTFTQHRRMCFDDIRTMRLVAENMSRRSDVGLIDRDKATALLMNTPANKMYRLGDRYTDWKEEDIRSGRVINQRDKDSEANLQELLQIPDHHDRHWEADAKRVCKYLRTELPPQSLPVLLKAISSWSTKEWSSPWVKESLGILSDYLVVHGVPEGADNDIKMSLNELIGNGLSGGKYEEIKLSAMALLNYYTLK